MTQMVERLPGKRKAEFKPHYQKKKERKKNKKQQLERGRH
jgi:hypothetical protein